MPGSSFDRVELIRRSSSEFGVSGTKIPGMEGSNRSVPAVKSCAFDKRFREAIAATGILVLAAILKS